MQLSPRLALLTLGAALGTLLGATPPNQASPESVIWRVSSANLVGGHIATVYGTPVTWETGSPDGPALFFNGVDDGLLISANPLEGAAAFTIEVLFKPDSTGPAEQRFFHLQDNQANRALLETRMIDGRWALDTFLSSAESKQKRVLFDRTKTHPADRWTWVALVYRDGHMAHYIDGVLELADAVQFPPLRAGQISLGVRQNKVSWFKGGIREIRFHRTALPPEKLQHHANANRDAPTPTPVAAPSRYPVSTATHASNSDSAASSASTARSTAKN